jgi:peroxiredoxin
LGRLYKEFKAENCEVLLILGEPVEKAKHYAEILHLPNLVLADPERTVYHRYELEKVFLFLQRTASLVIDRQGIIRYIKSATNPNTWLQESHELLKFVKTLDK